MNLESLSREELFQQAEQLDIEITNKKIGTPALINKIKAALNGVDDEDQAVSEPSSQELSKYVEINFAKDENNKQPVAFGLNGKSYRFPRGKWVKCPRILLPTIRNCVRRVRDDETGEWIEMDVYPCSTRGE